MVLNNVTKFHKILIKNIRLRERTSFHMVIFHKQRAITTERMVRYGQLSNHGTKKVTKFHKILIKSIRVRERTSFRKTYVRKYVVRTDGQG